MHTYRMEADEDKVSWTVGYYRDSGTGEGSVWVPLSDHVSEMKAARRVNYLNGGNGNWPESVLTEPLKP